MSAINSDFKFNLNVSTGAYPSKPTQVWRLQYATQNLTASDIERLERQGHSFCYNFKDCDEGGLVGQEHKTLEGFTYTNAIFYDFDKMNSEMSEFVSSLEYQPTLSYTTYSDGRDGYHCYRLVYVFDRPVSSVESYDSIYYAVAAANGFADADGFDYRKVNQQYFGGGARSLSSRSDVVYSLEDFSSYYEAGASLRGALFPDTEQSSHSPFPFQNNNKKETIAYCSQMEKQFREDLFSLSPKTFITKYDKRYRDAYLKSLSTELTLSEDGKYYLYPDDYQTVKRNWSINAGKKGVCKWPIGSDRKTRLYYTAQILKHNCPTITAEQMVYSLVCERYYYYNNNDNKLCNRILLKIADSALTHEVVLEPCRHPVFSINKDYWSYGNMTPNQAKNIVRKELKEREVLSLYDFGKSVKQNMETLKKHGIKVGKTYLYQLRKRYGSSEGTAKQDY